MEFNNCNCKIMKLFLNDNIMFKFFFVVKMYFFCVKMMYIVYVFW